MADKKPKSKKSGGSKVQLNENNPYMRPDDVSRKLATAFLDKRNAKEFELTPEMINRKVSVHHKRLMFYNHPLQNADYGKIVNYFRLGFKELIPHQWHPKANWTVSCHPLAPDFSFYKDLTESEKTYSQDMILFSKHENNLKTALNPVQTSDRIGTIDNLNDFKMNQFTQLDPKETNLYTATGMSPYLIGWTTEKMIADDIQKEEASGSTIKVDKTEVVKSQETTEDLDPINSYTGSTVAPMSDFDIKKQLEILALSMARNGIKTVDISKLFSQPVEIPDIQITSEHANDKMDVESAIMKVPTSPLSPDLSEPMQGLIQQFGNLTPGDMPNSRPTSFLYRQASHQSTASSDGGILDPRTMNAQTEQFKDPSIVMSRVSSRTSFDNQSEAGFIEEQPTIQEVAQYLVTKGGCEKKLRDLGYKFTDYVLDATWFHLQKGLDVDSFTLRSPAAVSMMKIYVDFSITYNKVIAMPYDARHQTAVLLDGYGSAVCMHDKELHQLIVGMKILPASIPPDVYFSLLINYLNPPTVVSILNFHKVIGMESRTSAKALFSNLNASTLLNNKMMAKVDGLANVLHHNVSNNIALSAISLKNSAKMSKLLGKIEDMINSKKSFKNVTESNVPESMNPGTSKRTAEEMMLDQLVASLYMSVTSLIYPITGKEINRTFLMTMEENMTSEPHRRAYAIMSPLSDDTLKYLAKIADQGWLKSELAKIMKDKPLGGDQTISDQDIANYIKIHGPEMVGQVRALRFRDIKTFLDKSGIMKLDEKDKN